MHPVNKKNQRQITVASKGLVLRNGRALLVQRSQTDSHSPGMWEFPGGRVEFGEDPKAALLREIKEETGLCAEAGRILYVSSFVRKYPDAEKQIIIINYLAFSNDGDVKLSFEHEDSIWATQSQMMSMLSPGILQRLKENDILSQEDILIDP